MSDQIVTLKIAKCGECPHSGTFMDHRSIGTRCHAHGGRPFERENGDAVYLTTIPDWCPLLEKDHG